MPTQLVPTRRNCKPLPISFANWCWKRRLRSVRPRGARRFRSCLKARGLADGFRRSLAAKRNLLALFAQSGGDWLDRWFESDPIKALLGFDFIVGNYASPYSPGSAYVLLHHVWGGVNGKEGTWGHAVGGMGAITQAMAAACAEHGVDIRLDDPVQEISVRERSRFRCCDRKRTGASRKVCGIRRESETSVHRLMKSAELPPDFRTAHPELPLRHPAPSG